MEQQITTIVTPDGTIKVDAKLFAGYNKEALEVLEQISELTKDYKQIVLTVSENTGMKKSKASKYFKERFKESTKDVTAVGELFSVLDGVLE